MQTSNEIKNIFNALIDASTEIGNVARTKEAYGYKYATLDAIFDMLRLILPKHGLWLSQHVTTEDGTYKLETVVMHKSGEWMRSSLAMTDTELSGKANATQKMGASITYFRRYALSSIFGIATDEDVDGNIDAMQRKTEVKANAKTVVDQSTKARKEAKESAQREQAGVEIKRAYERHSARGESHDLILKHFANILKTDVIREVDSLSEEEFLVLGRACYVENKKSA